MIVTSTNQIEGFKIIKYVGVISAHLVAGTGLFSDLAAEVRDIVGGRSQSYQKQLDDLDKSTISLLEEKASKLGANGILGLKIDYDEISGKGKSMIMSNAIGTAVVLEMEYSVESNSISDELDFLKTNILKKKKYEAKVAIIAEGVITEAEMIKVLDNEIKGDFEFYQFLLTHHRLRTNPIFMNVLDTHAKTYQDEKDRIEQEILLNKKTEIEHEVSLIPDAIRSLSSEIENSKLTYKKIENDEALEKAKMFGKDFSRIIYASSSLISKANNIINKCNNLINTFSVAEEDSIKFDPINKETVEKLLTEAKKIALDARSKEVTLRLI